MEKLRNITKKLSNSILFDYKKVIDESITSIHSQEDGWCGAEEFSRKLQIEIRRSYRTGSPLSYVVFDLLAGTEGKYAISSDLYTNFLVELVSFISKNSREFDVRCLTSPREIAILLIDTPTDGAKTFLKKISAEIYKYFKSLNNPEFLDLLALINISAFPLNRISGTSFLETKPIIPGLNKKKKHEDKSLKKERLKDTAVKVTKDDKKNVESNKMLQETITEAKNGDFKIRLSYRIIKRATDIVGSLIGIILFLPLLIIIAIVIKLTSSGPILFKQKRIGFLGKQFTFVKFRSMRIDGGENIHKEYVKKLIEGKTDEINMGSADKPTYKITNDPRITKIGHILRKTSLDELPQLINVLTGQMSLVGPRPPIPYEVEMYKSWHLQRILEVKPGVTGLWQVEGRSSTTFDEMVRMDLQYVKNKSILMDLKIIIKTFWVVFNAEGAM